MFGIGLGKMGAVGTGQSLDVHIAAMYAAGEQGAWYDPSDWSTLSQDSAGTTPVTALGQPVGRMLDKSGRGNTASQPTAINRPVLQIDGNGKYYLAFNGTNSWMSTGSIDFTDTDKMTIVTGFTKNSNAALAILYELSANFNTGPGTFMGVIPNSTAGEISAGRHGTGPTGATTSPALPAPYTCVLAVTHDLGGTTSLTETPNFKVNGVAVARIEAASDTGFGPFRNYPLYLGARAGSSFFFNGQFYGLVLRGALSTTAQIASAERFMAGKTGVQIP